LIFAVNLKKTGGKAIFQLVTGTIDPRFEKKGYLCAFKKNCN